VSLDRPRRLISGRPWWTVRQPTSSRLTVRTDCFTVSRHALRGSRAQTPGKHAQREDRRRDNICRPRRTGADVRDLSVGFPASPGTTGRWRSGIRPFGTTPAAGTTVSTSPATPRARYHPASAGTTGGSRRDRAGDGTTRAARGRPPPRRPNRPKRRWSRVRPVEEPTHLDLSPFQVGAQHRHLLLIGQLTAAEHLRAPAEAQFAGLSRAQVAPQVPLTARRWNPPHLPGDLGATSRSWPLSPGHTSSAQAGRKPHLWGNSAREMDANSQALL
jgi:hypothetical protein